MFPAALCQRLRQEERELCKEFDGAETLADRLSIYGVLTKCRGMLLDIAGVPRRPAAPDPKLARMANGGEIVLSPDAPPEQPGTIS